MKYILKQVWIIILYLLLFRENKNLIYIIDFQFVQISIFHNQLRGNPFNENPSAGIIIIICIIIIFIIVLKTCRI